MLASWRERLLGEINCKVRPVGGDGDCFFRAISYHRHGHEENHRYYRLMTTDYMATHPDEFEAVMAACVEDGETLADYVTRMSKQGQCAD